MPIEIEASFLEINIKEIRTKLKSLAAVLIQSEILMKRKVFDYPDHRLEKIGAWIRVRDEGNKITTSYKRLVDRTITGTQDITITVGDFEGACEIYKNLGLTQISYQETKRETWELNGCEITIDTWPWIPTLVEVEGPTEDLVKQVSAQLGFDWSTAYFGSIENVYQKYYHLTEAEIDSWPEITFVPIPTWLEEKRIKLIQH